MDEFNLTLLESPCDIIKIDLTGSIALWTYSGI